MSPLLLTKSVASDERTLFEERWIELHFGGIDVHEGQRDTRAFDIRPIAGTLYTELYCSRRDANVVERIALVLLRRKTLPQP